MSWRSTASRPDHNTPGETSVQGEDLGAWAPAQRLDWKQLLRAGPRLARAGGRLGRRGPAACRRRHAPGRPGGHRDLAPTENGVEQSVTRLAPTLDVLQAQLAAAGQDYRPEWDDSDGVGTRTPASSRPTARQPPRVCPQDPLLTRLAQ
ncbi:hypothetical protein ACFW3D_41185 [Streptomyces sp. NPDC058864]